MYPCTVINSLFLEHMYLYFLISILQDVVTENIQSLCICGKKLGVWYYTCYVQPLDKCLTEPTTTIYWSHEHFSRSKP